MHLYSAFLCIVVHPKHFTIIWGGGGGCLSSTTIFWAFVFCKLCLAFVFCKIMLIQQVKSISACDMKSCSNRYHNWLFVCMAAWCITCSWGSEFSTRSQRLSRNVGWKTGEVCVCVCWFYLFFLCVYEFIKERQRKPVHGSSETEGIVLRRVIHFEWDQWRHFNRSLLWYSTQKFLREKQTISPRSCLHLC